MNLSSFSVKRPVTILMITFVIILLGAVSLTRIPIDLYPSFEIPIAIISTNYEGAGPQEVESLVTSPIEEVVGTVQNIKSIRSVSSAGNSLVILEFEFNTDMNFATLDVREKLDFLKALLPEGTDAPLILKIDPNAMPIIELSVFSADLIETQWLVEKELKPRLERLEGVASVNISGGSEEQIVIRFSDAALQTYGLDLNQIAQQLRLENLNLPGGTVDKGTLTLSVRAVNAFDTLEDIENFLITLPAQANQSPSGSPASSGPLTVRLQDIAEISYQDKELSLISKTNGIRSLNISILKQSGTNTVQVANQILAEVKKLQNDFKNITIDVSSDQAEFIRASIRNVTSSAGYGALLAIAILYLFLRNIRTTFIIGTSIPVSIIATFILLFYQGITLNLMTLGGLALGIGMLVDNAIVVLENIYRFRQMGYSREESAILGTKEVAMAVTASTLTTIAVFLPISFVEGLTATIFRELALTVTFSLSTSLIVSLTLIPMMSSKLLVIDTQIGKDHHGRSRLFDWFYNGFDHIFFWVEKQYKSLLNWALRHRIATVIITLTIFGASLLSIYQIGLAYFPNLDQGEFSVSVTLPNGSQLKETQEIVSKITDELSTIKDVAAVYETLGSGGNRFLSQNALNAARIRVRLVPLQSRIQATSEIAEQMRTFVKQIPGAEFEINITSMGFGGMSGAPVSVTIKGNDLGELDRIGADVAHLIATVPGTREIENSNATGNEEVLVNITREKANYYGLTGFGIANNIKSALLGQVATSLKTDGKELDVVLKSDERYAKDIQAFKSLPLSTPYGFVTLEDVSEISLNNSPTAINRQDQSRIVTITAQIVGRELGDVVADLEKELAQYAVPPDYEVTIAGENADMQAAFKDLQLALILAVIIVYMVMAAQFESLIHPFTIILTVPLAFSGALLGLFITGYALSVPAFIGMIMLSGIVVNNAIVLVDYINTRRASGESIHDAIEAAGPIRLRPILMTTLTTVLGLIPLALGIGEGAEAQAPLATTVIFGLGLATLLTLVFIPVVYSFFEDLRNYAIRLLRNK